MKNNNRADLHIHTTASDGIYMPEQIIDLAANLSISRLSFTDHDCVDAYSQSVFKYAEQKDVRLTTGLELSCRQKGRDVHILGYLIDVKDQVLIDTLNNLRINRIKRCRSLLEKLKSNHIDITFEEVVDLTQGSIGRVHIARMMTQKGYVANIKEAFELYLSDGCSCYVEKTGLSVKQAIDLIRNCGGFSVLAHPKLIEDEDIVYEVIDAGIQGIEVYHKRHDPSDEIYYTNLANRFDLLITGGSDFHGRFTNEKLSDFIMNENLEKRLNKE